MKKWLNWAGLFFSIIALDQATKWLVLTYVKKNITILPFVSFQLVFNRGISWGLFHSNQATQFALVTTAIISIIVLLAWVTINRWKQGKSIFGETLVLAGAISNLLDRFFFHGVIDFILLSYKGWSWPYFNLADMSIVIGVFIMLFFHTREN